jgi:molybdopterin-binding protein
MNALEFINVKKTWNDRPVLDLDSLAIQQGSRVALVGSNGSGKTTLLSIAAMLTRPDSGEIFVMGERVNWFKAESFRKHVSFASQEPFFFRGSLLSNMIFALSGSELPRNARLDLISKSMSLLGLNDLGNRSPRTFSGGERRRASIARALLRETSILLLDEPFTHMDNASVSVLVRALSNLPHNPTIVFSTHDLGDAYRIADSVLSLQEGTLSPWTPENLYRMRAGKILDGFNLETPGGLAIYYPGDLEENRVYTVSLHTNEVILSREKIDSSARNSFFGQVKRIEKTGEFTVLITIDCLPDLPIRATLTDRAMRSFGLNVGDNVWAHFKSTAIHVFE